MREEGYSVRLALLGKARKKIIPKHKAMQLRNTLIKSRGKFGYKNILYNMDLKPDKTMDNKFM